MNLFIIQTPFQLINAYEFIHKFKTENNILLVIEDPTSEDNNNQINLGIKDGNWYKIIRIRQRSNKKIRSSFLDYVSTINKLKNYSFNYIVTGTYDHFEQVLMGNLKVEQCYLIDDGTATIFYYSKIKNREKIKFIKRIRYCVLGLKPYNRKTLHFFTIFKLLPFDRNKVILNDFAFLKMKYKLAKKETSNSVYIIGQNYVETKCLQREEYDRYLEAIIQDNIGNILYYLPHRREDEDNLCYIKKNFPQLNVLKNIKPAEQFFLELPTKPACIVGMYSTLLFSLNRIFDDIEILGYKLDGINNTTFDIISNHLKENGILQKAIETK